MAVAVTYSFSKEAIATYDQHLAAHGEELRNQPHRQSHVCFETDEGYTVVDVWDSIEAFEEFGEMIGRFAGEAPEDGAPPPGALHIAVHRVHNFIAQIGSADP